jgi:hypothetical protein
MEVVPPLEQSCANCYDIYLILRNLEKKQAAFTR